MKDDIKLPLEFISGNNTPVTVATIKRERMEEIIRDAIKADRQKRGEPLSALAALVKALRDRHYGRMPDEVQAAYDHAWSIVYASPQPTIPDGWQLVPKKPKHEMRLAGKHTIKGADTTFEGILAECSYLSMLEAAPKIGEEK